MFLLLARVAHQPKGLVHLTLDSERASNSRAIWNVNPDRRIFPVWVFVFDALSLRGMVFVPQQSPNGWLGIAALRSQ